MRQRYAPLRDRDSRADGQCDMGSGGAGTARAAGEDAVMVAEPKARVAWSPRGNRAQMRLLKCQVFEIFFGGARGGGKTDGVLGEFGAHASRYGKDAIGLMVRRTRAELVETIERSREIYGPLGWKLSVGGRSCKAITASTGAFCRAAAWCAIGNGMACGRASLTLA